MLLSNVNLFDTWDGKPTKEQSEIQTNLLSELEDASVKVTNPNYILPNIG